MKKNSVLRKVLTISLAAAMMAGTGFTAVNSYVGMNVSVNAAETYAANSDELPFIPIAIRNQSTISAKEIVLGQTVTVNAKASKNNCTYAVYYKQKAQSEWTTKQRFGTNDTVTIKPAKATDYDVCVKVKDSTGKIIKKYFEVKVNEKLANTSTLSSENIVLGQKITAHGTATGGIGKYQYQVFYKQTAQSSWTKAQDVKVKDDTGKIEQKYFIVKVGEKLNNTSTISAVTIRQGASVTLKGSATGGAGNYTYAVYYKQKAQSKWTTKQNFDENAIVSVKPAQATDYDICIKVKDTDGTISKKYFTVTVN